MLKIEAGQKVRFAYNNNHLKKTIEGEIAVDFPIFKKWMRLFLKSEDVWESCDMPGWVKGSFVSVSNEPKRNHEEYWVLLRHNGPGCLLIRENDFLQDWEGNLVGSVFSPAELTPYDFYEKIRMHPKKYVFNKDIFPQIKNHPTWRFFKVLERLYYVKRILEAIEAQFQEQKFLLTTIEKSLVNSCFYSLVTCFDILSFSESKVTSRIKGVLDSLPEDEKTLLEKSIRLIWPDFSEVTGFGSKRDLLVKARDLYTHMGIELSVPVKSRVSRPPYPPCEFYCQQNKNAHFFGYSFVDVYIDILDVLYKIVRNIFLRKVAELEVSPSG